LQQINHRLHIAYDGTGYRGWQVQGTAPTIQLHLETVLSQLWQTDIRIHGSGRTDTGVHARGQVAHFLAPARFKSPQKLKEAMNALLPPTIRIRKVDHPSLHFHSRFSAKGKEYEYRITHHGEGSPFEINFAWQLKRQLNTKAMQEAAQVLIGEHDFAAFASNPGYSRETTVRTIYNILFTSRKNLLTLRFTGSGFLYRMVRNLTGALVRVGDGRLQPTDIKRILKSASRSQAPPPAPAAGLYLNRVYYRQIKNK